MPLIRCDGEIVGYRMQGRPTAYYWGDARALLLLGMCAVRAAWRALPDRPSGFRTALIDALRLVGNTAHTLEPIPDPVWRAATDALPPQGTTPDRSRAEMVSSACGQLLLGATAFTLLRRNTDLAYDPLAVYIETVVQRAAFSASDDRRALDAIRRAELRCLVHLWTSSLDVVPTPLLGRIEEIGRRDGLRAAMDEVRRDLLAAAAPS
jgi:hypothetical protein